METKNKYTGIVFYLRKFPNCAVWSATFRKYAGHRHIHEEKST